MPPTWSSPVSRQTDDFTANHTYLVPFDGRFYCSDPMDRSCWERSEESIHQSINQTYKIHNWWCRRKNPPINIYDWVLVWDNGQLKRLKLINHIFNQSINRQTFVIHFIEVNHRRRITSVAELRRIREWASWKLQKIEKKSFNLKVNRKPALRERVSKSAND